jgi:hypothetical protein
MGIKEPEPWLPRWVRQKLREKNNGLPPNDPNHDEKPPADTERPVCKCDFNCQSHMKATIHTTGGIGLTLCPPVHSIGVGTNRRHER